MKVEYYTFKLGKSTEYRGRYLDYEIILAKDSHYKKNKKWWWRVLYGKEGMGLAGEDFSGTTYLDAQHQAELTITRHLKKREQQELERKEQLAKKVKEWYNSASKEQQSFIKIVLGDKSLEEVYFFLKEISPK